MSYLGSSAAPVPVAFSGVRTQSFSGNGSTSLFTLNRAVTLVTDIEVIVNNVQQSPFDGSYSLINGGLGLQFSENVSAGTNNIYVIYRDQPVGSLIDPTAVRKTGDTMTGTLTVQGNILAGANSGGSRVYGVSGSTNTTVVLQAGAVSGAGPNLELTADHYAYLDSNQTIFRSTDGATQYGKFDTAGRLTVPNQPAFSISLNAAVGATSAVVLFDTVRTNIGSHYSTSTGRFTCPVSGTYLFSFFRLTDNNAGFSDCSIRKNGVIMGRQRNAAATGHETHALTVVISASAGDYIDVYHDNMGSGGYIYGDAGNNWTNFSGYLIG